MGDPHVQAVAERFRGSPLEPLVQRCQAAGLLASANAVDDGDALEADFVGAWEKIELYLNKAGQAALMARGSPGDLSDEDKERYRQLIRSRGASSAVG
jgi:hypothetical protein